MLQSVGNDTDKAAKLSNTAIIDMSDNANKMGTSMDSIQQTYQSLARGNYAMLDNLKLGYGGTKKEMQRLIKDASKLDKTVDSNSMSFGNEVKAIHAVQEKMGILGTTNKEAMNTISGSLSMVKSAWSNVLPALIQGGDLFDQTLSNLIESVGAFGNNIMPAIQKGIAGAGKLIAGLSPEIGRLLPKIFADFCLI